MLGETGLGKSTLLRSLFLNNDLYEGRSVPPAEGMHRSHLCHNFVARPYTRCLCSARARGALSSTALCFAAPARRRCCCYYTIVATTSSHYAS